jgi:transcriptional regulator with XRE-family HTH domain
MSFKIRIDSITKKYGITINELGRRLGYGDNPAKLYRLKDETKNPSVQIIQDILKAFPEINARWLITGNDDMLVEEDRTRYGFSKECIKLEAKIELLEKQCAAKDKQIQELLIKGSQSPGGAASQPDAKKKAS